MNIALYRMTTTDVITSLLSTTIVLGMMGDIAAFMHYNQGIAQHLSDFAEWYTRGVGSIVVTVNAYLVWRKYRRYREYKNSQQSNTKNDDAQNRT